MFVEIESESRKIFVSAMVIKQKRNGCKYM